MRRSQRLKVSYEEAYHLLGISRHALAERDEELKRCVRRILVKSHHFLFSLRLRRLMINESQLQNLEKINAGAYGEVYRARWTTHTVAVKFLKVAVLESDAGLNFNFVFLSWREVFFLILHFYNYIIYINNYYCVYYV